MPVDYAHSIEAAFLRKHLPAVAILVESFPSQESIFHSKEKMSGVLAHELLVLDPLVDIKHRMD